MSIKDLSVGERIVFRDANNIDQYSKVQQVYCDENEKYYARVKSSDGRVAMIDENTDFISAFEPTSKKVEKTLDDKVNHPSHYTYGDIEIMDFIEQVTKDYKPELAFAIGNAIKYISRANRKNGKEDLDKARWYLNRAFEKWEG
ncbi:DUF3310 domain-containing protein [Staphylococcus epidermidis]|jgi:hypothetical protein|uniref:DUF3310 domain-containing protein n=1 Tax=Staphylococcus epidermidis TaxID=1282 RepID=UPI00066A521E|nr:DUF3310 domain-containing protein [Staphylococcus epidermidis]KAA9231577.1 DUF3310 domain-containing protein [Staphylococcus epidermidis]MCG1123775.1 DUF3310 domain-containing protein [Staphylococcus epidermidis]MCG1948046.1 DUF3310 domain-containing protein [Staphylococcus epidermidis]PTE59661.1 DUF3310 domain-containing protein [Staphylococcus epidermidis]